jgi:MHS family proline/betaine transporter-like MFS transporter
MGESKSGERLGLVIGASSIGMIIEIYDFLVYGYVATIIGKLLFPPTVDPLVATLQALLVFGVGFAMRPVGAFIFAHVADKIGRKIAFIITLSIMGVASLGIGLLPTYSQIGILATILLVLFRMLQGISLGGEFGSATVFLQEHVPTERRAFYNSILQTAWAIGPLLAVLTLYINSILLSPEAVASYGWRYPFYLGAALVVLGLFMRLYVAETPIFKKYSEKGDVLDSPIVVAFRRVWKEMLLILIVMAGQAYVYYTASITAYTTFWLSVAKIPLTITTISFMIMYAICIVIMPITGYFIDKYGRRPFIRWGYLVYAILLLPLYSFFTITKDVFVLTIVTLIPLALSLVTYSSVSVTFAELVPANVRVSAFNIAYQIGVGVIGGFIPFISTAILLWTNSVLWSVSYIVVASAIASLVGWLWLPETKGWDYSRTIARIIKK